MTFPDQMGREVLLPNWPPRRIVSLVPSQTELLCSLGLEAQLVGITKFCVRPAAIFREKTRVGGTKTLDLDKIHALRPDLILANKEENMPDQVTALMAHFPVWVSDVPNLEAAVEMIRQVGQVCDRATAAEQLTKDIEVAFAGLHAARAMYPPRRVAYFIWRKPWMVAGTGTFIHDMLTRCGFENVFSDRPRYPECTPADIQAAKPDLLLLSSEPFPFKEKHIAELQALCPGAEVRLVDGELFSWYGSRLLEAAAYFKEL
jgi:ABC-type Fe3+-hydroxamate transport system substrate-binding protein